MCIRDRTKDTFGTDETLKEKAAEARTKFCTAMDDDLNTPDALAAVFDLVKDCLLYTSRCV